jgi:hypothetical protein
VSRLRIFGCEAYVLLEPVHAQDKQLAKSTRCVYLGPDSRRKADVFWDLAAGKYRYSRNATFNEAVFPFAETSTVPSETYPELFPNPDPATAARPRPALQPSARPSPATVPEQPASTVPPSASSTAGT